MLKLIRIPILLTALLLNEMPSYAQESMISRMIAIQEAVVEITADKTDLFQIPVQRAAVNPLTGQVLMRRKMAQRSWRRSGAGVVIHPSGIIATNAHTASAADRITVTSASGESFSARPIDLMNGLDLLLLKIDSGRPLPFVELADSDRIGLHDEVLTIGNSSCLKHTISGGTIIGIGVSRRLKYSGHQRTDLIQTSVNLYQGDSGGPLFNHEGQLIGLMTADEGSTDHSSFAIPSNKIRESLLKYLSSQPPYR